MTPFPMLNELCLFVSLFNFLDKDKDGGNFAVDGMPDFISRPQGSKIEFLCDPVEDLMRYARVAKVLQSQILLLE